MRPTRRALAALALSYGLGPAAAKLMVADEDLVRRDFDPVTHVGTTTNNASMELLFEFKAFPVYMGVESSANSATDPQDDVFARMSWHISKATGIVQLNPLVPLRYVYLHQHNAVIGGTWQRHHDAFAELIARQGATNVLEIGGGHGYLAEKLLASGQVKHWTMVDPNPTAKELFKYPQLSIVKAFVEDLAPSDLPAAVDAVVHSHTLEHIYDPLMFFRHLAALVPLGSLHIFTVPNLLELARLDAPCMHFEHTLLIRPGAPAALRRAVPCRIGVAPRRAALRPALPCLSTPF